MVKCKCSTIAPAADHWEQLLGKEGKSQVGAFHFTTITIRASATADTITTDDRRPRTSLDEISAEWPPFDQIALAETASVALLRQQDWTVCKRAF